jgi:hypothetical protein
VTGPLFESTQAWAVFGTNQIALEAGALSAVRNGYASFDENFAHEVAHLDPVGPRKGDIAYSHQSSYRTLSPEDRLMNAESYACAVFGC